MPYSRPKLSKLRDVDATDQADGKVVAWNAETGQHVYVPVTLETLGAAATIHTHHISDLTDLPMITVTPAAGAIPQAGSSGKIADGWLGDNVLLMSESGNVSIPGDTLRLATSRSIANQTGSGVAGESCWDAYFEYRCVATNSWQRTPRSTVSTPATIAGGAAHNWAPGQARVWQASSDNNRAISGIACQQWPGDEHILVNVGSFDLNITHQDGGSTSGNRIIVPGGTSFAVKPGESVRLIYGTSNRWLLIRV